MFLNTKTSHFLTSNISPPSVYHKLNKTLFLIKPSLSDTPNIIIPIPHSLQQRIPLISYTIQ